MTDANDTLESKRFYDAILATPGHEPGVIDDKGRCFYFTKHGIFSISKPTDGKPATHGKGNTTGFAAADSAAADAWHVTGAANGN